MNLSPVERVCEEPQETSRRTLTELKESLPRLLYAADVPVASTTSGSLLLYRLLKDYPADRLVIAEGLMQSVKDTRLPGVRYAAFRVAWGRLLRTRLCRFYAPIVLAGAPRRTRLLKRLALEHNAEAVLTVAHQYSWLTAAALAAELRIPLHVILHDDPWFHAGCHDLMRNWFETRLCRVCRQARSRLCVSPNLAEFLQTEYRAPGSVLYPSWGPESASMLLGDTKRPTTGDRFTIAYAGNLFSDGYRQLISSLAAVCASQCYRLLLFCNISEQQRVDLGLAESHVQVHPLVPPSDLPARLRASADALLVPMSFEDCDRRLVAFGFPSKLSEYTSIGLPLVIWGPKHCSAVRWAKEHEGTAELVVEKDSSRLASALRRLADDPDYCRRLAKAAMERGRALFSYDKVISEFFRRLAC